MEGESRFRIFNPEGIHKPMGYSHVAEVTAGKLVYIAGQVALDKAGNLAGRDDFKAQVRQVFENLKTAVAAAGGRLQSCDQAQFLRRRSVAPSGSSRSSR